MAKTVLERELEYIKRMKDRDMVQVKVWVPKGQAETIRKAAIELRGGDQR